MILDRNNTLGYSVIEGRLKIFVKKGIISESQNTNENTQEQSQPEENPQPQQNT